MHLLNVLADLVQPAVRHPRGILSVLRHLGGFGLFLLAILDSSPIPGFSGPDIVIALLGAGQQEPWYYYTIIATAGSLVGAFITFRIARRAGEEYLHRKFGQRKVAYLVKFFKRWGTGCLVVTTLFPLPFPTTAFVAIAGVLDYPLRTLLLVVGLCRALRYAAIALIASHYGRGFAIALRHPGRSPEWMIAIGAVTVVIAVSGLVIARRMQSTHAGTKS